MQVRAALPSEAVSPRAARRFVGQQLVALGMAELDDRASLVVSELVTNAVLHARTDLEIAVSRIERGVRIEVSDRSPARPVRRTSGLEASTGRGLLLIETAADDWGVVLRQDGKTVWCELRTAVARSDRAEADGWTAFHCQMMSDSGIDA